MQTPKMRITGSVVDTLILNIYPTPNAQFNLYEDDGTTEGYRNNSYSFTNFNYRSAGSGSVLSIEPDGKAFAGQVAERCYVLKVFLATKPMEVSFDGVQLSRNAWSYDDIKHITTITTERMKVARGTIEIR